MQALTVYCGSYPGNRQCYVEAAERLGTCLAEREITLIYGGAQVGLMGALADSVLGAGGQVVGIIPKSLNQANLVHQGLTRLEVVDSIHDRKSRMLALGDGLLALPGGFGTLEELFEALAWCQLKLHQKPCAVLNVNGYFDALMSFLDQATHQGFLTPANRNLLLEASTPEDLLAVMMQPLND
jgi:uncharacterized protein (TIGR00730 family)